MNLNESPDPRSSMWAFIAYYLRFQRRQHGLTAARLSEIMGCAQSTTSRLENLEQRLTQAYAERVDKALNTGGVFSVLVYYARRASDPDWFRTFVDQERDAFTIRIFAGQFVPGLLQIEAYARALLASGRNRDIESALSVRMARQSILRRPEPPELWVTLSENVLDWPVGGDKVLKEQLAYLLTLSKLPTVRMRIVPRRTGAYEGLDGSFMILTGDQGEVAFVEAPNAGRLVTDGSEVQEFKDRFERIGAHALDMDSSKNLIAKLMEDLA
ncbi:helix-turn-helix domain-containing protein [Actinomadura nitritigenes]|uniref:helix-turn-helix domain-containing protein n=1 Tax=Actinomadura nitritigenes TaxID=134602 RepID=UPI003D94A5FE